jgi:hypothetical protein
MTDDDSRHGTHNGYKNLGCRCDRCKEANRIEEAKVKARRIARFRNGEAEVTHGLYTTYGNWGCRCRPCTDAWVADHRARRARNRVAS